VTAPRKEIEASLAERGRPVNWATEQEAAVLSGYPADGDRFRKDLPDLEKAGFPKIDPLPGKRFIPAIVDFWARRVDALAQEAAKSTPPKTIHDFEDRPHARQRLATGY